MTLWVIKIGTSLLRGTGAMSTKEVINNYCSQISDAKDSGDQVILVTSGAVGLGCTRLKQKGRPKDLVSLQAAAAVGQGQLMSLYSQAMSRRGYDVAQVLLTRTELSTRVCYMNASKTLDKLLEWQVLPVVNENDTISNEELKYGDNDTLSALVASAVSADQLILLTDIDRLYSKDPNQDHSAEPITDVHNSKEIKSIEDSNSTSGDWGTGGIKTKLSAARIATESGITVQLADGRNPKILGDLLKGSRGGTVFHPQPNPIGNRKSWLAHAIKPLGEIILDKGASEAVTNKGASILLVGITKTTGNFTANQPVKILDYNNKEIAKGIASLSSEGIKIAMEKMKTSERSKVVVHRDVLVLMKI